MEQNQELRSKPNIIDSLWQKIQEYTEEEE